MPAPDSLTTIRRLKTALWLLALLPLIRLLLAGCFDLFGGLGANPVEMLTRSTGTWALVALCLTLGITPLRRLTGWQSPLRLRRMLGLFAAFYGTLHLSTYLWLDQYFDILAVLKDLRTRPFILLGFIAWTLMLPLAITSTDRMVRRLGRRWRLLHRLIHPIAIAAILHYLWHKSGKNDYAEVGWYAAIVALLLGWRALTGFAGFAQRARRGD